jgi:hypothetical protein
LRDGGISYFFQKKGSAKLAQARAGVLFNFVITGYSNPNQERERT